MTLLEMVQRGPWPVHSYVNPADKTELIILEDACRFLDAKRGLKET